MMTVLPNMNDADGDEGSVPGLLMTVRLETREEIGSTGFAEGVSCFFFFLVNQH